MKKESGWGNKYFACSHSIRAHSILVLIAFFYAGTSGMAMGMTMEKFMQQSAEYRAAHVDAPIDTKGSTYLIASAYYGNLDAMQALISSKAEVDKPNNSGRNALNIVIHRRSAPMVRLLIDNRANVHGLDEGDTSLHQAILIRDQNPEVVQLLCDAKVDVDGRDNRGHTPLLTLMHGKQCSCEKYHEHRVRAPKEGESRQGLDSSECRQAVLVRVLLNAKADPRAVSSEGHQLTRLAPVEIAAHHGCLESVELLLDAGALVCPDDERDFNYLCGECEKYEGMVPLLQEAWEKQQVRALKRDRDGLVMWGNIAAVGALALVLGYAFSVVQL